VSADNRHSVKAPLGGDEAVTVKSYRKKPVVIEAIQWTGDNLDEIWDWTTAEFVYGPTEVNPLRLYVAANDAWLDLEVGEWIIKDSAGFYPCKADIFAVTYEAVADGVYPPRIGSIWPDCRT
jgi:hypothetical protein